jgi:broad specificity phosphatase PhoE
VIPASTSQWLAEVPLDAPVAFLMRHSERGELPIGEICNEMSITEVGARLATELGRVMRGRLRSLRTSPVLRCVETAACLQRGADYDQAVMRDHLLGDPGV